MKKSTILIALAFAAFGGTLQAQQTLSLSLDQAQQYAIEHSKTIQNASLDVQKAEAAKWEAISSMLPQVKTSFDYQNMCGYAMNMTGFSIPMNPNGTFGVQASIALTGQQIIGALISKISTEMSDITLRQSEQSTRSSVKGLYTSILVMEKTVELLDSNLFNMQRLEASTNEAVRVGASEQVDADKFAVTVAQLRTSINATKRSLSMLYNSLKLQLGMNVNDNIVLTDKVDGLLDVNTAANTINQGFELDNNYSYQLLKKSEELAKQNVTMAWMKFTPTLSTYYQYSKKTYFGKNEGFNMTPPNMVGASVSLPLWSTGSRAASVKQAKIDLEKMQNTKQQTEDALLVQYDQLKYNLVSAIESYRIQDANLDVSRRVFDNVSEKYKYGRASSLEVTNASSDLISAQSSYIQAVMEVINAQTALEDLINQ